MRNSVSALVILVISGSAASASDVSSRLFTEGKQASAANTGAVAGFAQANRSTRLPVLQKAADIPVIALPKSLRPTRPPAGSPL
jgi:hypothetical protein